jgi:hypothetical protein
MQLGQTDFWLMQNAVIVMQQSLYVPNLTMESENSNQNKALI